MLFVLIGLSGGGLSGPARADGYTFGIPPGGRGENIEDVRRLYRPLLDHLSAQIGAPITQVSARTYDDVVQYFTEGRIHFGSLSPMPYVTAKRANPAITLLATELAWNADRTAAIDSYEGLVVTLKKRADIRTVADLRGTRFGFVAEESTSGFQYPNAILKRHGIDYRTDFDRFFFLGAHPRVTDAVAAGSIDAGATWNFNLAQAVILHGDIFKVVESVTIPNRLFAVHPSVPAEIRERAKQALLTVDPAILEGLPIAGFVERPDSFYDIVREIAGIPTP